MAPHTPVGLQFLQRRYAWGCHVRPSRSALLIKGQTRCQARWKPDEIGWLKRSEQNSLPNFLPKRPMWPRRLNQEKVMSRAVSSAPWGLARWYLAVAPIPLGGGGTRTTANCTSKCSEHEIPRQPVTSGASAACARRGAEVLPATTAPPRPVQQPPAPPCRSNLFVCNWRQSLR